MFSDELKSKMRKARIVAVLTIDDAEDAVPLAKALLRGGISIMELTLRTPAALGALERVCTEVPEMLAGAGTVLSPVQVRAAKERGAAFGVAPGLNSSVVTCATNLAVPFAPGVMTPSEIENAYELGCNVMKLYPAELSGGIEYLKNVSMPYAHLEIEYIPLGGLSLENLKSYLEIPYVLAVGGSWLATRKLVQEKAWDAISRNCEKACEVVIKTGGPNG
jgi:2-dehydro-3-deoxyphosphogluconate aldolase/(4S)-4-hydroxy-2-oxoglutarate aldolase